MTTLLRLLGLLPYRARWDVGPTYGFARRCGTTLRRLAGAGGECDCPAHGWGF
ncbi:MAG: hypothetical protein LUO93_02145 [Methanomicrobiales archaeon]|nr:hypothetical protein [Methanomicrobiales archaeon]